MLLAVELKRLREEKIVLQRQVSAYLEIDNALYCKIERGERYAKREHIEKLAIFFNVTEYTLLELWLADKVMEVIKDEECAISSINLVTNFLNKK